MRKSSMPLRWLRLLPSSAVYPKDGIPWLVVATGFGGQRQRVAIARLCSKMHLLILDEATSAVDNETEAALQRSIHRISRNRQRS